MSETTVPTESNEEHYSLPVRVEANLRSDHESSDDDDTTPFNCLVVGPCILFPLVIASESAPQLTLTSLDNFLKVPSIEPCALQSAPYLFENSAALLEAAMCTPERLISGASTIASLLEHDISAARELMVRK